MPHHNPFLPSRASYDLSALDKPDRPKGRGCFGWMLIIGGCIGLVAISVAGTLAAVGWNNGRTNPTPSKPAVENIAPEQLKLPEMKNEATPKPTATPGSDVEWI